MWASALIVGAALGAAAGVLALLGQARLARGLPPLALTVGTVRRDLQELSSMNGHRGPAEEQVPGLLEGSTLE